jgi:orotidine-5'-phosphate decarboxylase
MMRAAVEGARRGAEEGGHPTPMVIAVTVLSSMAGEELASPASLAFEASDAGLDGVVVSGEDVRAVREVCGEEFCLVVPGIRPHGANGHDQVRVLTPSAALDAGADYLVVGRPITAADDPVGVAKGIALGAR